MSRLVRLFLVYVCLIICRTIEFDMHPHLIFRRAMLRSLTFFLLLGFLIDPATASMFQACLTSHEIIGNSIRIAGFEREAFSQRALWVSHSLGQKLSAIVKHQGGDLKLLPAGSTEVFGAMRMEDLDHSSQGRGRLTSPWRERMIAIIREVKEGLRAEIPINDVHLNKLDAFLKAGALNGDRVREIFGGSGNFYKPVGKPGEISSKLKKALDKNKGLQESSVGHDADRPFPSPILSSAHPWNLKWFGGPDGAGRTFSFLNRHDLQAELIKSEVLPQVIERQNKVKRLKISVVGSATGEEIATLMAAIIEAFESHASWGSVEEWDIQVEGVEINPLIAKESVERLQGRSPFVLHEGMLLLRGQAESENVIRLMAALDRKAAWVKRVTSVRAGDLNQDNTLASLADSQIIFANAGPPISAAIVKGFSTYSKNAYIFLTSAEDNQFTEHALLRFPGMLSRLSMPHKLAVPKWALPDEDFDMTALMPHFKFLYPVLILFSLTFGAGLGSTQEIHEVNAAINSAQVASYWYPIAGIAFSSVFLALEYWFVIRPLRFIQQRAAEKAGLEHKADLFLATMEKTTLRRDLWTFTRTGQDEGILKRDQKLQVIKYSALEKITQYVFRKHAIMGMISHNALILTLFWSTYQFLERDSSINHSSVSIFTLIFPALASIVSIFQFIELHKLFGNAEFSIGLSKVSRDPIALLDQLTAISLAIGASLVHDWQLVSILWVIIFLTHRRSWWRDFSELLIHGESYAAEMRSKPRYLGLKRKYGAGALFLLMQILHKPQGFSSHADLAQAA